MNKLGSIFGFFEDPTKQKELLERALKINEKHFAEDHVDERKAPFFMDPLLQADSLEYSSTSEGGVEDLSASKEMLERALMLREEYNGKDHVAVARALNNLGNA